MEIPIKIDSFKEWELLHEISRLRDKSKEALILSAVEGYYIKEISAMLKISESAIKKRLQRGREELSRQLGVRQ
ncbi:ECF-type sigma factor [Enterocloster sp. OA13]|uniref:RNA polymerase sigma factor n=1 Tax=Enterocloster sp. OA13 TaxID=2914161 RepID=UPI0004B1DAA4|nr:ECF-type sigma factor [Enterocloster sp. OA13]